MKLKAIITSVQRTQYGRLEIHLGGPADPQSVTVPNTKTTANAYTVGREVEITIKAK